MKLLLKSSFLIIIEVFKTVLFKVIDWIFGIQNNVTFLSITHLISNWQFPQSYALSLFTYKIANPYYPWY